MSVWMIVAGVSYATGLLVASCFAHMGDSMASDPTTYPDRRASYVLSAIVWFIVAPLWLLAVAVGFVVRRLRRS